MGKQEKNKNGKPFDICFVDADSLIYRIALKTDLSLKVATGYYDKAIEDIEWATVAKETKVALKGIGNFRYDIEPDYKGNRKVSEQEEDPNPQLTKRRKELNDYAYSLGHFQSDNCEADDVVSIWAQQSLDLGQNFVIAHIDKDIDMVEGWHYNFTKETLYYIDADTGWYKMCIQMLTGDSTDNIQGLKGIGPKKAEKLLTDVPKDGMIDAVKEAWKEHHPEDWEEKLEVCWNLIYMRRNWDGFKQLTIAEELNDKV